MKYINGFFQLDIRNNGTYVDIYPPVEGGSCVDVKELSRYLERQKIFDYDICHLQQVIEKATDKKVTVKVTDSIALPCDETADIKVTSDGMKAIMRFYPPSKERKCFSKNEIMGELAKEKIKFGISEKVIDAYVAAPQYCRDIVVAIGKEIRQGTDAFVTYHFDTNPVGKPKLLEDGSVDFHQLNIFSKIKKGDVLATLTPADPGEAGVDVYGRFLSPNKVKTKLLKHGRNIVLTEDKKSLVSQVDGDVKLEGDTVFVSDTYTVLGDVDPSTGDIDYEGNVIVTGNVRTGFTIRAKGSIQVNGVVEGAYLYSGSNIVLKRGVQGMNKGYIEAQGDILTNFIESCKAVAKGNVTAGSVLHSHIEAGHSIKVNGRKGFIIGGTISAGELIEAHTAGNRMETETNLKVGVDPDIYDELKKLQNETAENQEQMIKINDRLKTFKQKLKQGHKFSQDQIKLVQSLGNSLMSLDRRQGVVTSRIEEIMTLIEQNNNGRVRVADTIYPGVRIVIGTHNMSVKDAVRHCQFRVDKAELVCQSY